MRKRAIPKNTKYFTYYNCNPKDRYSDDCAVRAVSAYLNKDWCSTVREMTELGLKTGYVLNDPHCIRRYLDDAGLTKQKEPRNRYNKKITVREWLDKNPNANCIANVGSHHMTVIKNGKVLDIADCSWCTMHSYWE